MVEEILQKNILFRITYDRKLRTVSVYRNIEARSCIYCCSGKTIIITNSEYSFAALVIQQATYMRHIVLLSLVYPGLSYVYALSHKRQDSRKKTSFGHKICVLTFATNFV